INCDNNNITWTWLRQDYAHKHVDYNNIKSRFDGKILQILNDIFFNNWPCVIAMFSSSSSVNNSSIVTTEWVAQNYDSIIPVDGSWHMPNTDRNPYEEYFKTRLKNARFFGLMTLYDYQ
ncbi:7945_t:CDS:2, partial [Scutellospora calospora]